MKINLLRTVFMILFAVNSWAQTEIIEGKIVDNKSEKPISFASVSINGTTTFVLSDKDGIFQIKAKVGNEITVSHISYKTQILTLEQGIVVRLLPGQVDLSEIIVMANPMGNISQSTSIHDATKQVSQPRSVGHLFSDVKGFGITKRGAYASEPVFRAFKYEQLNIQYDGGLKILNACPNRMDPITTHVIPEEIEKIEIIRGPFSVRFGQNFGGVINLVSKKPDQEQIGIHGAIEGGYESNGNNLVSGASIYYVESKFDLKVNGSYRDFGNYEDGNGTEVPSSFRTTDYALKLGWNPKTHQRLQVLWRQSFARDILHAGLPMDSPFDDSLLAALDYKHEMISNKISSFLIKMFYSNVDHLMTNGSRPNFMMVDAQSPVEVATFGGKVEIELTPSDNMSVFAGIDANLTDRHGNRTRIVKMMNGMTLPEPRIFNDKIWQDASLNDVGVFAETNYKLGNNLSGTTGMRADFIATELNDPAEDFVALYGTVDKRNETNFSINSSLKYRQNKTQFQFALGRGVRTASMVERYINHFTVGSDPYEYVGNPYLDPEVNTQLEFSFMQGYDGLSFGTTVFYSFLRDYISAEINPNLPRKYMPTVPPVVSRQYINIDKAYQFGFEFDFQANLTPDFSFKTTASYTKAENTDIDEPLPHIPPFKSNIELKFEKNQYWIALGTRLVSKQDRVSSSFMEEPTAGYGITDIRMGIKPLKSLSVGFAVLNIFDKAYYDHLNFAYKNSNQLSGRIYESGRNFTTYIKYNF